MKIREWRSNEWCTDEKATTQEDLQNMARQVRENCKVTEIECNGNSTCTIYENKNLGIKYWIKDNFGHISEIIEARSY